MNRFFIVPVCFVLAGCGSAISPAPADLASVQTVSLTSAQKKIVTDGVGEMVANGTANTGEITKLAAMSAFRLQPAGDIQVCGDVSYKAEPGKPISRVPYYLELAEQDGQSSAKRGQVGFDKLKKSKVDYLCQKIDGE